MRSGDGEVTYLAIVDEVHGSLRDRDEMPALAEVCDQTGYDVQT